MNCTPRTDHCYHIESHLISLITKAFLKRFQIARYSSKVCIKYRNNSLLLISDIRLVYNKVDLYIYSHMGTAMGT